MRTYTGQMNATTGLKSMILQVAAASSLLRLDPAVTLLVLLSIPLPGDHATFITPRLSVCKFVFACVHCVSVYVHLCVHASVMFTCTQVAVLE